MARLIPIEGLQGEDCGRELRAALVLSATRGQGFEMVARGAPSSRRAGLRVPDLAAVRAAAMACGARLAGAFEGSLELRFEPGAPSAGSFEFTFDASTSVMEVLQTVLPVLALGGGESLVAARGPTHLQGAPTYHSVARHWLPLSRPLGLDLEMSLARAGFLPRAGGEVRARVPPLAAGAALALDERGALLEIRGIGGAAHLRGDVPQRVRDAARALLWERRRLEAAWDVLPITADSPGSFAQMELVFEGGRAAFTALGERRVRPEVAGERLARSCLLFLDGDAAIDGRVADQLVVVMAATGRGGRLAVDAITPELLRVARVAQAFGLRVEVAGSVGGPGLVAVESPDVGDASA